MGRTSMRRQICETPSGTGRRARMNDAAASQYQTSRLLDATALHRGELRPVSPVLACRVRNLTLRRRVIEDVPVPGPRSRRRLEPPGEGWTLLAKGKTGTTKVIFRSKWQVRKSRTAGKRCYVLFFCPKYH